MKTRLKRLAAAIGELPLVYQFIRLPPMRGVLGNMPGVRLLYGNAWDRTHPYDRAHGTDTSGMIGTSQLPTHDPAHRHARAYAGSQPSIIRASLAALPQLNTFTFVDLGCGKGRPLLVASEFPFADIVGVELSPSLAEIARRNAAIMANRFPDRTAVRIVTGNATEFPLPAGNLIVFLYNPFGDELIDDVVKAVEAAIKEAERSIYVIYYNPVGGHCFDASSVLKRYFAAMIAYAPAEIGFGPDTDDPVVIWQGGIELERASHGARIGTADGRTAEGHIVVTIPGVRSIITPT